MKKAARWHLVTTDELAVGGLVDELGIEPIVATLLVQRGVDSAAAARQFFQPDIADLHHPFAMKDMDVAVARLDLALQRSERILLYGD